MSTNMLTNENLQHSFASTIVEPVIDTFDVSIEDILAAYNLNFEVRKQPLYADANGNMLKAHKMATVRYDNTPNGWQSSRVLGIVSPSYQVIQNYDKVSVFEKGLSTGLLVPERGFQIDFGRRIIMQFSSKSLDFEVKGVDPISSYITLLSSHDGSLQILVTYVIKRIICSNQMRLVISKMVNEKQNNVFVIKHTKSVIEKMRQVKDYYDFAFTQKALVADLFNKMYDKPVKSDSEIDSYLISVFSNSNILLQEEEGEDDFSLESESDELAQEQMSEQHLFKDDVRNNGFKPREMKDLSTRMKNFINDVKNYIETGKGQKEIPHMNLWKLFNGVTGYMQHQYRFRKKKNRDAENDRDAQIYESIVMGNAFKINQRAFDNALLLLNN